MKLLAFKPAIFHFEQFMTTGKCQFSPTNLPEFDWPLNRIMTFTCRNGHTVPDPVCGCGIEVYPCTDKIEEGWNILRDKKDPIVLFVVQLMGTIWVSDDRDILRAERIYPWGIVKPLWLSYGGAITVYDELHSQYTKQDSSFNIHLAYYTDIGDAMVEVTQANKEYVHEKAKRGGRNA